MKRIILTIVFMLGLTAIGMSQTDTIFNRCERYHYTGWYDTIHLGRGVGYGFRTVYFDAPFYDWNKYMKQEYTSEKIAVKGLAVYVLRSVEDFPELRLNFTWGVSDLKHPEYALIGLRDGSGMVFLDSVRWDTVQPKLVQLKQTCTNLDSVAYCYSYENYFKSPIFVADTFFVGATGYSNQRFYDDEFGHHFAYIPTYYIGVQFQGNWDFGYSDTPFYEYWLGSLHSLYPHFSHLWGLFFAIVDYYDLKAESADSTMGSVEGGGRFSDLTSHTITAIPAEGYCFTHWNDGSTENPRTIDVSQDTLLTAFFHEVVPVTVRTFAEAELYGHVEGGGQYMSCDEVTLTAVPSESYYHFVRWSDGVTDNPRTFTVLDDTTFTAIFDINLREDIDEAASAPAFSITPNPAHDRVTVTLSDSPAHASLVLRDAVGKELLRLSPVSQKTDIPLRDLPAGTYLLTLSSPQGSSTQKLIVE